MSVQILIPTYGRLDRQITWDSLHPCLLEQSRLVCHPSESTQHRSRGRKILECPVQGTGMATVRSWMMDWCVRRGVEKVLFMDDDLTLQKRGEDFRVIGASTSAQQQEMLDWVGQTLDQYAHCAFTERNAAWDDVKEAEEATKGIQVVGYNVPQVLESGCRFDLDVPPWFFIEDYHMTLQLFRRGLPNLVSRVYRVNFGSSNAPGGCSNHRSPKRMEEAAKILERLHPGIVKAVQKETKTSYGGGVRWNVRVQWKRAFRESMKNPGVTLRD